MESCVKEILKYCSESIAPSLVVNNNLQNVTSNTKLDYFMVDNSSGDNNTNNTNINPCRTHPLAQESIFWYNNQYISSLSSEPWTKEQDNLLLKEIQCNNNSDNNSSSSSSNNNNNIIDWTKLVHKFKNPNRTAIELLTRYHNHLNPLINKNPWTSEEESKLYNLAIEYDSHNWTQIAKKLNTNRTPLACLEYYQRYMNIKLLNQQPWSLEEDKILVSAVAKYGFKHWNLVSYHVPGRSCNQCINLI